MKKLLYCWRWNPQLGTSCSQRLSRMFLKCLFDSFNICFTYWTTSRFASVAQLSALLKFLTPLPRKFAEGAWLLYYFLYHPLTAVTDFSARWIFPHILLFPALTNLYPRYVLQIYLVTIFLLLYSSGTISLIRKFMNHKITYVLLFLKYKSRYQKCKKNNGFYTLIYFFYSRHQI